MVTTFGFISTTTLVIILVIALVIFGPGKLPELGKALGKGINEFKSATNIDEPKKEQPVQAEQSKEETKVN